MIRITPLLETYNSNIKGITDNSSGYVASPEAFKMDTKAMAKDGNSILRRRKDFPVSPKLVIYHDFTSTQACFLLQQPPGKHWFIVKEFYYSIIICL